VGIILFRALLVLRWCFRVFSVFLSEYSAMRRQLDRAAREENGQPVQKGQQFGKGRPTGTTAASVRVSKKRGSQRTSITGGGVEAYTAAMMGGKEHGTTPIQKRQKRGNERTRSEEKGSPKSRVYCETTGTGNSP